MSKFKVILAETYRKNVKSFGFLAMVLSPIVLLLIIGGIIHFAASSSSEPAEIAVLTENEEVLTFFQSAETEDYRIVEDITSQAEAEEAMEAEELDGYLTISEQNGLLTGEYVNTSSSRSINVALLSSMLTSVQVSSQAVELGLTEEEVTRLMSPVSLEERSIQFEDGTVSDQDNRESMIRMWGAYVVAIAIFIFMMTYSSIIAEEIASEKGTRIMEVILSSVSSTTHFFGKLAGILLICLTQIVLYTIIFSVSYPFIRDLDLVQSYLQGANLGVLLQSLLGYSLVYFVLGIILYICIAAFFGSLVTKIEDVSKAITPLVFIALIGFYGGMFAFASPNQLVVKVLSYIPLFTPFIMPFRIASETVSGMGIFASIVLMIGFVALVSSLSLMLYRSNVLIYSDTNMVGTIRNSWNVLRNERKASQG